MTSRGTFAGLVVDIARAPTTGLGPADPSPALPIDLLSHDIIRIDGISGSRYVPRPPIDDPTRHQPRSEPTLT